MEPALKTRLLGAAVLIALAIIFVPMFFSGHPDKNAVDQSVSLKIPDQPDAQLKTTTLSVGPDSASANAGSNDPDRVATVDVDAAKPPRPAPAGSNVAVAPSHPTPVASGPKSAPPPVPPANVAQTPPGTTPTTAPQPQPVSSNPGAAANAVYSLNLGTYAERDNADKLIARLVKQGFAAHSENSAINNKPATRVVVGPYPDRAAAEAARLKLKSAAPGVPLALISGNSDQIADAPAGALPANRPGGWAVQLGAFGSEIDANRLRDQLRTLGFDGYVDDVPSGKGGKLWRVRAGPVNERSTAEQLKTQIAQKMKISGIIVTQS